MLTVTEMLRKKGVVEKFVEFFGDGLANLPLADRATIGNMSPEFGSTCGIFPIDGETLRYLELSGRPARADRPRRGLCQGPGHVAPRRRCGGELHRRAGARPRYRRAALAGPKRPQDRVPLRLLKQAYRKALAPMAEERSRKNAAATGSATVTNGSSYELKDGAVLIAAITSARAPRMPDTPRGVMVMPSKYGGLRT